MADAWSPVGGDVDLYEELDLVCTSGFILLTIVIRWECVIHTVQNVIPFGSEYTESPSPALPKPGTLVPTACASVLP